MGLKFRVAEQYLYGRNRRDLRRASAQLAAHGHQGEQAPDGCEVSTQRRGRAETSVRIMSGFIEYNSYSGIHLLHGWRYALLQLLLLH